MTSLDSLPSTSPDSSLLVVEAFIDGDTIDLEALKSALARPDGREHLVDLLALRDAVWAMAPRGYAQTERTRKPFQRGVRWFAVAAGVVLSLTTGYLAGQETAQASTRSPNVEMIMDASQVAVPAPTPTRVITLQPGVNWTETAGGR